MYLDNEKNTKLQMYFYREEVLCSQCESVLEGLPITLPCKDVLCDQCYGDMVALGENQCHTCQQKFKAEWQPERQMTKTYIFFVTFYFQDLKLYKFN